MFVAIYTGEFTHMSSALEPLILARLEFHSQHLRVNFSFLFDFFFSESSHWHTHKKIFCILYFLSLGTSTTSQGLNMEKGWTPVFSTGAEKIRGIEYANS